MTKVKQQVLRERQTTKPHKSQNVERQPESDAVAPPRVVRLQQHIGNQGVQRMLQRALAQLSPSPRVATVSRRAGLVKSGAAGSLTFGPLPTLPHLTWPQKLRAAGGGHPATGCFDEEATLDKVGLIDIFNRPLFLANRDGDGFQTGWPLAIFQEQLEDHAIDTIESIRIDAESLQPFQDCCQFDMDGDLRACPRHAATLGKVAHPARILLGARGEWAPDGPVIAPLDPVLHEITLGIQQHAADRRRSQIETGKQPHDPRRQ